MKTIGQKMDGWLRNFKTKSLLLIILFFYLFKSYLPGNVSTYFFKFCIFSFIFYTSMSCIGKSFRSFLLKSSIDFADFPLGLSLFTFFINVWIKFNSNVFIFILVLFCFFFFGIYFSIKELKNKKRELTDFDFACWVYFLILFFCLTWFTPGNGLLMFPLDFDSGMIHLALPKRWQFINDVYPQVYIRAPFLGQYAHSIYYFLLMVFKTDLYIKILNLSIFYFIFQFFKNLSKVIPSLGVWPLFILGLMVWYPDTREYIVSTNLDWLFFCLLVPGCLILLIALQSLLYVDLYFGTLLLAFSAGVKHFGFMMSAPILVLFYVYFHFQLAQINLKACKVFIKNTFLGIFLFLIISLSFYIQNLLAGNSILFPFFGAKENTYLWTVKEIGDFASIIKVWGHRSDFFGFFTLPMDIVNYPSKYQLLFPSAIGDLFYPSTFLLTFLSILASFFKSKLRILLITVALVSLLQLYLWYSGSQVVRYLLPNVAISGIFSYFVISNVFGLYKIRQFKIVFLIGFCLLSLNVLNSLNFSHANIPWKEPEVKATLDSRYGDIYHAIDYIRSIDKDKKRIFHNADASFTQYMIDLEVCGDWFGPCRFEDFFVINSALPQLEVKPWDQVKEFVNRNKIYWVIIKWSTFYAHQKRPDRFQKSNILENCFEHVKEYPTMDIFKIKDICRK